MSESEAGQALAAEIAAKEELPARDSTFAGRAHGRPYKPGTTEDHVPGSCSLDSLPIFVAFMPCPNCDDKLARAPLGGGQLEGESKDHKPILIRRGEVVQTIPWDMLADMSTNLGSETDSAAVEASSDGISAFVAHVLDQLTLSAWLPAALLVSRGVTSLTV